MSKKNTITEKKYLDLNGLTMFLSKLEEKFVSIQNTNTYLKYVSQTLTNDQKLQVATNIGNNTMLSGHLIKYNENGTITSNGFINENLLYVLPNSTLSESENVDIFATKNSLKTINGESILGIGDINTDNSYFLDFDIYDINDLLENKLESGLEYDGVSLSEAIQSKKNIYIYRDKTSPTNGMALVNCHRIDYIDMSFYYEADLYSIQSESNFRIAYDEVTVKSIGDIATKSDVNASLTQPTNYQILYTTTDDSVIEFADTLFDVQLVSNVYENGRGVITFNGDVLSIPGGVFREKNNLKTIIIPDSVTSIGDYTFQSCTSLTSVTIPDSVTSIGNFAFNYCTSLTSVTIPDNVTSIGNSAFTSRTNLTSVYCKATTPPSLGGTSVFDGNTNLKIYVPIESLETYKNAEGWSEYSDKICSLLDSNSVKTINGESIIGNGDITISGGSSNANVQAVDTGDIIDDVNVEYATTAYVDGLIGDINSVLESIING